MFKRKVWLNRIFAASLAGVLMTPATAVYAAPDNNVNNESNIDPEGESGQSTPGSDTGGSTITPPAGEDDQTQNPGSGETTTPPAEDPETPDPPVPEEPDVPTPEEPEPDEPLPEQPEETPETPEEEEPEETPGEDETPEEEETPETDSETITNPQAGTNQGLISQQQIIIPPMIEDTFRFVTVEKDYAVAREALDIYSAKIGEEMETEDGENAEEEPQEDPIVVGEIEKDGLCYVLKQEEGSEWVYIESGVVRGFVKAEDLLMDEEADNFVTEKGETNLHVAQALVDPIDNPALTYTRTTIRQTVIDKVYAISTASELNIREGKNTDSRIVGTLAKDALCYILADSDQDWVYVESEDVRGFVKKEYLLQGEEASKKVEETGEEQFALATQLIEPEENAACYYTITSVKEGMIASAIRTSMLEFAQQFLGNPYVWGGTSLTNGADCSGFVQSIYAQFGYSLPRTSREQALYGTQIPVEDAAPGDLIFYAKNGTVYHVVMYMGDGQIIQAGSRKTGINISTVDTEHAVWATRVISDADSENIKLVNAKADQTTSEYTTATADQIGDLLGNFKLTAYCNCSLCSGQWAGGPTASGTMPVQGRTVAMGGIPFGTKLVINGQLFTVEDRGTPYGHVDIFMNDHNECNEFGVGYANVFLAK